jgi:hypothetical protein
MQPFGAFASDRAPGRATRAPRSGQRCAAAQRSGARLRAGDFGVLSGRKEKCVDAGGLLDEEGITFVEQMMRDRRHVALAPENND